MKALLTPKPVDMYKKGINDEEAREACKDKNKWHSLPRRAKGVRVCMYLGINKNDMEYI